MPHDGDVGHAGSASGILLEDIGQPIRVVGLMPVHDCHGDGMRRQDDVLGVLARLDELDVRVHLGVRRCDVLDLSQHLDPPVVKGIPDGVLATADATVVARDGHDSDPRCDAGHLVDPSPEDATPHADLLSLREIVGAVSVRGTLEPLGGVAYVEEDHLVVLLADDLVDDPSEGALGTSQKLLGAATLVGLSGLEVRQRDNERPCLPRLVDDREELRPGLLGQPIEILAVAGGSLDDAEAVSEGARRLCDCIVARSLPSPEVLVLNELHLDKLKGVAIGDRVSQIPDGLRKLPRLGHRRERGSCHLDWG